MYKNQGGVQKIMELKKVLNLLNNQYFKSFKRFQNAYSFMPDFNERVKKFNEDYLNIISAVLSGDVEQIRTSLRGNSVYYWATYNEKDKLDLELLGAF